MTEPIQVSVILTSYNHAKYLREAIDSVLQQTFQDFELIIWDDASTDESWQIITSYTDSRILTFRNETTIRAGNIKKAISEVAKGRYIAIHHSDDVWEPQKLEKQVAFLENNPEIGAVFTWAQVIDEDGQPFEDQNHFYYKVFEQPNRTRHEWLNFFFYQGNVLCHPSVLIRKICYETCGLYRYGLAQSPDFDMWVRLCLKYEIHVLPEKLVRFRVRSHEANTSGNRPEVRARGQFEYLQVLTNYTKISTFEELKKVFPAAEKYARSGGEDLGFILGMVALETKSYKFTELLGLNLLFEALNDSVRAKKIRELYNFTQNDFIVLTGKHDVFSKLWIEELTTRVAETENLKLQVAERDAQLAERDARLYEIMNSKAWKVGLLFRRMRILLIPPNSFRDRILRKFLSIGLPCLKK